MKRDQLAGDRSRLGAIAALVPAGSYVADIGSGHGRLARGLLNAGRARRCIATERTSALAGRIGRWPPSDPRAAALELRHGDGLRAIAADDAVDVVVIAGLGARTILRILDDPHAWSLGWRRLVLQPQTEAGRVRDWLEHRGLAIVGERVALERGRLYVAIAAERLTALGYADRPPGGRRGRRSQSSSRATSRGRST